MKKRLFLLMMLVLVVILSLGVGGTLKSADNLKPGDPIKIGILGPMDMRTGAHLMISGQMAVEKINKSGRVAIGNSKHPIELVKFDSNEFKNVADAASAAERAISVDKVHFLLGGVLDEPVMAIQDIAADNEIIYISNTYTVAGQHTKRLTENYDRYKYCFTVASSGAAETAIVHIGIIDTIAKAVMKAGIAKPKVAQLVAKTTPGDAIVAYTTKVFPAKGMEIAGTWRPSNSASDLRAETAAIKASGAHIIYAAFSGSAGIVFGKELKELKIPAVIGGSPAASLFPKQGIEYSVTMMTPTNVDIKITDKNVDFYRDFLKRSGNELCVGNTYDSIMNLAMCIQKAGSLDPDAIIKLMETEEFSTVVGKLNYDPKEHKVVFSKGYRATYGVQELPKGKYTIVWPTEGIAVKVDPVAIPKWMTNEWKKKK
jgi:branched-chain amino acid transport system substrate-binding protein